MLQLFWSDFQVHILYYIGAIQIICKQLEMTYTRSNTDMIYTHIPIIGGLPHFRFRHNSCFGQSLFDSQIYGHFPLIHSPPMPQSRPFLHNPPKFGAYWYFKGYNIRLCHFEKNIWITQMNTWWDWTIVINAILVLRTVFVILTSNDASFENAFVALSTISLLVANAWIAPIILTISFRYTIF